MEARYLLTPTIQGRLAENARSGVRDLGTPANRLSLRGKNSILAVKWTQIGISA